MQTQLLQEQDEEVCKLRQLLKVQQGQLSAQEQQHVQDVSTLQTSLQEQQQRAALMHQKAMQSEAEGMILKTVCSSAAHHVKLHVAHLSAVEQQHVLDVNTMQTSLQEQQHHAAVMHQKAIH